MLLQLFDTLSLIFVTFFTITVLPLVTIYPTVLFDCLIELINVLWKPGSPGSLDLPWGTLEALCYGSTGGNPNLKSVV